MHSCGGRNTVRVSSGVAAPTTPCTAAAAAACASASALLLPAGGTEATVWYSDSKQDAAYEAPQRAPPEP